MSYQTYLLEQAKLAKKMLKEEYPYKLSFYQNSKMPIHIQARTSWALDPKRSLTFPNISAVYEFRCLLEDVDQMIEHAFEDLYLDNYSGVNLKTTVMLTKPKNRKFINFTGRQADDTQAYLYSDRIYNYDSQSVNLDETGTELPMKLYFPKDGPESKSLYKPKGYFYR